MEIHILANAQIQLNVIFVSKSIISVYGVTYQLIKSNYILKTSFIVQTFDRNVNPRRRICYRIFIYLHMIYRNLKVAFILKIHPIFRINDLLTGLLGPYWEIRSPIFFVRPELAR